MEAAIVVLDMTRDFSTVGMELATVIISELTYPFPFITCIGANRYFYLCLNDLVAFGGGASFALSLNEDL